MCRHVGSHYGTVTPISHSYRNTDFIFVVPCPTTNAIQSPLPPYRCDASHRPSPYGYAGLWTTRWVAHRTWTTRWVAHIPTGYCYFLFSFFKKFEQEAQSYPPLKRCCGMRCDYQRGPCKKVRFSSINAMITA